GRWVWSHAMGTRRIGRVHDPEFGTARGCRTGRLTVEVDAPGSPPKHLPAVFAAPELSSLAGGHVVDEHRRSRLFAWHPGGSCRVGIGPAVRRHPWRRYRQPPAAGVREAERLDLRRIQRLVDGNPSVREGYPCLGQVTDHG